MRRLFLGLAITGIAALAPAWALAGDQEVAQQVASNLRHSGRMKGYSIGVKVSEGTAWLAGTVRSQQQMVAAVQVARQTPGVGKVISNLSVGTPQAAAVATKQPSAASRFAKMLSPSRRSAASQPAVRQVAGEMPEHAMTQLAVAGTPAEVPDGEMAPPPPATLTDRMPRTFTPAAHTGASHYYAQKAARRPIAVAQANGEPTPAMNGAMMGNGAPMPAYVPGPVGGVPPAHYDHPQMPNYAWPSYAAHPNYAALSYPKQYSPTAWPFIGPFYPYPQVPLGWRKVSLEWDDGWWMLDFKDSH